MAPGIDFEHLYKCIGCQEAEILIIPPQDLSKFSLSGEKMSGESGIAP
jgi:hypothetical protein